jgi:hypothetical protein
MLTLQEEFSSLMVGPASHFRNLTIFPLIQCEKARETEYLLLDDAISNGWVRVTELRSGATVSELMLENEAEKPVLMVNGEELVGAKQNRVLNITILEPTKCAMSIPVSCVESGRWQ